MKKGFVFLLLCGLFFSCSFLGNDKGFATISFTFNDEAFDALSKTSGSRTARAASDEYTIKVKLTADGVDYDQEKGFSKGEEATITFDKIPVGVRAKVSVKIYSGDTEIASGESEEVTIHAGQNVIIIKMKGSGEIFPIVIYSKRSTELKQFQIDPDNPSQIKKPLSNSDSDKNVYSVGVEICDSIKKGADIYSKKNYPSEFVLDGTSVYFTGMESGEVLEVARNEKGQYETVNTIDWMSYAEKIITVQTGWSFNKTKVNFHGYDILGDEIYFLFTYSQSDMDKRTYLCSAKKDGSDFIYGRTEDFYNISCMKCALISDDTGYFCYYEGNVIYIIPMVIDREEGTISFDGEERLRMSDVLEPTLNNSLYPEISDLIIQNNVLYVAVYYYTSTVDGPIEFLPGEAGMQKAVFLSNGGVLKVDLADFKGAFDTWRNGESILGWYKETFLVEGVEKIASIQAPLNLADKYFYGARRFIAKKPGELIIADDGGYADIDVSEESHTPMQVNASKNMNRVVTVKLSDETISAVEVNVPFEASLDVNNSCGIKAYN